MNTSRAVTIETSGGALTRPALPLLEWKDPRLLRSSIRAPARMGSGIILAFVLGFGLWGSIAPLSGGAIAPGLVSPDQGRKTVQHLEGGVIHDLLVRDGDVVEAGEPLLVLRNLQPKATFNLLRNQHLTLLARQARLDAERAGASSIAFPPELRTDAGELDPVAGSQSQIFEARRAFHAARRALLRQRLQQLAEQIKGHEAQVTGTFEQLKLIREEARNKDTLLTKGLIPRPEALRLKRMEAEFLGRHGELLAEIARANQNMGETNLQLLALDAERTDQIAAEADKVRVELADVLEKLRVSEDVLNRTVVAAPVSGTVVNLRFKTVGGVVQRGEPILDIVPEKDTLLIEAHVSPMDIDIVRSGLPAQIRFSAYSSRRAPPIAGEVRSVSADRIVDQNSRQSFYLAKVEVNRQELQRLAPSIMLVPGMPVEVMIVTEERTMVEYLLEPFRDALRRSFREV
jgi:HlyD family secretion protein/epimerase transport system membrane fusion protein